MPRKRPALDLTAKKTTPRQGDLDALFGGDAQALLDDVGQLKLLPLDQIESDPTQPRTEFQDESLQSLANSIQQDGVIQPIEVVQIGRSHYRIIHGERRWRAAKLAQLDSIPAIVKRRDYDEVTRFVRQLVENIQREDLNDIDRAAGLARLREMMQEELNAEAEKGQKPWSSKMTMAKVAERIGYSRQRVSQLERLLDLPEEIQQSIIDGVLTERDTRIFAKLNDRQKRALHRARVVDGTLSQAESKRVADYIKRSGTTSVNEAIRVVQAGEDKIRKTESELRQTAQAKQLAQMAKALDGLEKDVKGVKSAEKVALIAQLETIQQQLNRLLTTLNNKI